MATTSENTAKNDYRFANRSRKPLLRSILAALLAFGAMLGMSSLSACTKSGDGLPAAKPSTLEIKDPPAWPLTGLPREDQSPHPAVAVKIENTAAARPQSGLESADVVFEEMVEGGLTRYNAIFHSNLPTEIGPVRSVRPMDPAIVAPFGALLVYSGGIQAFKDRVAAAGVHGYNENDIQGALYRVNFRRMPHNLYLSIPKFFEMAKVDGSPEPQPAFQFAAPGEKSSAASLGKPAAQLSAVFPAMHAQYTWTGSRWQRLDEGSASSSRAGTPLQTDNVVVIMTSAEPTGSRDVAGAAVMETVMVGSGDAYVASNGSVAKVKWAKDSEGSPIVLSTEAGDPVTLAPGTTWVELLAGGTFTF